MARRKGMHKTRRFMAGDPVFLHRSKRRIEPERDMPMSVAQRAVKPVRPSGEWTTRQDETRFSRTPEEEFAELPEKMRKILGFELFCKLRLKDGGMTPGVIEVIVGDYLRDFGDDCPRRVINSQIQDDFFHGKDRILFEDSQDDQTYESLAEHNVYHIYSNAISLGDQTITVLDEHMYDEMMRRGVHPEHITAALKQARTAVGNPEGYFRNTRKPVREERLEQLREFVFTHIELSDHAFHAQDFQDWIRQEQMLQFDELEHNVVIWDGEETPLLTREQYTLLLDHHVTPDTIQTVFTRVYTYYHEHDFIQDEGEITEEALGIVQAGLYAHFRAEVSDMLPMEFLEGSGHSGYGNPER